MADHSVVCSMSRAGKVWDNAPSPRHQPRHPVRHSVSKPWFVNFSARPIFETVRAAVGSPPGINFWNGQSLPFPNHLIFEGISVDEYGKQHYLDVHVAYRQACLNAIEYMTKFGYSRAQAYAILGTAPVQGHISGVVDIPNACATLWLPTEIFDFDIMPNASGPIKHIEGGVDIPMSPDK